MKRQGRTRGKRRQHPTGQAPAAPRRADEARRSVIDLHSHTTRRTDSSTQRTLVRQAWTAGIRVLGGHRSRHGRWTVGAHVTPPTAFGLTLINGIEITAIDARPRRSRPGLLLERRRPPALDACLARQREPPAATACARLAHGWWNAASPVDIEPLLAGARTPNAPLAGRRWPRRWSPQGTCGRFVRRSIRFLGEGGPAWVRREGRRCASRRRAARRRRAGLAGAPRAVPPRRGSARWRDEGLDAIEVYHSEHGPADVERYRALAEPLGHARDRRLRFPRRATSQDRPQPSVLGRVPAGGARAPEALARAGRRRRILVSARRSSSSPTSRRPTAVSGRCDFGTSSSRQGDRVGWRASIRRRPRCSSTW